MATAYQRGRDSVSLWKWIVDTVTGQEEPESGRAGSPSSQGAATAVAEPAEEAVDESQEKWWAPEGVTQTEPGAIERPDLPPEGRALENMLVSHFDGHDLTLPPLPVVPARVLTHLRDRNCDFGKVAKDVSDDQVIAAAVLRTVNSPLYRGVNKITSLLPAVTRLGTRAMRTLMMHESVRAMTFDSKHGHDPLADLVWAGSLSAGCVMRGLSQFTSMDAEEAALLGLLHDIGNVIVLKVTHQQSKAIGEQVDIEVFEYLCHECHQEFGELISESWQLPDEFRLLLSDHHSYPEAGDPLRIPRLQLQVCDMITSMLGYTRQASYNLLETRAVRDLKLAENPRFIPFLQKLPAEVEETLAVL